MLTRGVLALWKCIHISYRGAKNAFRKLVFVRQSRAFREKCLVYIRHYLEQIPVWALELVRIIKLLRQKLFDFGRTMSSMSTGIFDFRQAKSFDFGQKLPVWALEMSGGV